MKYWFPPAPGFYMCLIGSKNVLGGKTFGDSAFMLAGDG